MEFLTVFSLICFTCSVIGTVFFIICFQLEISYTLMSLAAAIGIVGFSYVITAIAFYRNNTKVTKTVFLLNAFHIFAYMALILGYFTGIFS